MKKTWLGISSYTYPFQAGINRIQRPETILTPIGLINKAAALDVSCVQFSDNMPLENLSDEELEEIRDYAAARGILLENGMRCMTPERLQRYLEISALMKTRLLRIITDGVDFEPTADEIVRILRDAIPFAERYHIILAVENHDRFLAREYADIVKRIDHPQVGLVVDSTNSLAQEEPMEEVLRWMAPYCACLHIKDYTIKRSNSGVGLSIVGAPAGQGRQQIPYIISRLRSESPRDFSTVLESWMECCETVAETTAQEDRWALESVDYLKRIL